MTTSNSSSSIYSKAIKYTPTALKHLMMELANFHESPPYGIYLHHDENDIGRMLALIIGPADTPYEDGFFFFEMRFPADYPFEPPHVEIRTTNTDNFRFNPNFYLEGKVCLSILGTWSGPGWTCIMNIMYVLTSIQMRMNEYPIENEPGWENCPINQKCSYNNAIRELSLRWTVINQIKHGFPKTIMHPHMTFDVFLNRVQAHFLKKFEGYLKQVQMIPDKPLVSRFMNYERRPDLKKLRQDLVSLKAVLDSSNNCSQTSSQTSESSQMSQSSSESSSKSPEKNAENSEKQKINPTPTQSESSSQDKTKERKKLPLKIIPIRSHTKPKTIDSVSE